jgi:hypothetical protein
MTGRHDQQLTPDPTDQNDQEDATRGAPPTVRIRNIPDLLAWIPYGLGFHPDDSLCVVGLDPDRPSTGPMLLRGDLPTGKDEARSRFEYLAGVLATSGVRIAALIGYGTAERVTPAMEAARAAAGEAGIVVREALRVEGGRYWSYLCTNEECCPPEGTPYDVSTSQVAATAIAAGLVALPGRDELSRSIAPIRGSAREAMRQATTRAEERVLRWLWEYGPAGLRKRMVDEGVPYVRDLLARGGPLDDDEVAWLGVLLIHLRVRDEAWVRTDVAQLDLWRDVLRRVEDQYAAAPACLTTYAAYLSGDGALANIALDRAFAADPDYSMAGLLSDMIRAAVPPWKARLRMTPEELAAYDPYTDHADDTDLGTGRS